ncbi:MAG: sugar ABC transporter permease [Candidatus Competibacteraceae bacterium]
MALLILAALQMLPTDCYEAARVDGIHPVKVFFKVTLPLIKPALMVAVIFRLLDALRIFDLIYVLTLQQQGYHVDVGLCPPATGGLPAVGYGSAASTLLFLTVALCTVLYITFPLAACSMGGRP